MQQFKYKMMSEEQGDFDSNYGSFSNTSSPVEKSRLDEDEEEEEEETLMEERQDKKLLEDRKVRQDKKLLEGKKMLENRISPDIAVDIEDEERPLQFPVEPLKTLLALVILLLGMLCSTLSLALTHDRVPSSPPLPDIVLDNFHYTEWALRACNIIIILSICVAVIVAILHRHRSIILRRVFLMWGLLYMYRAITMFITVLPNPDPYIPCSEKMNQTTFSDIVSRMWVITKGGGLSDYSLHVYCGDYIFSGHTMTLTLCYMTIKDYSPRNWFLLHWVSLISAIIGVALLLLQRVHYTVDVVIAYWITSRLWYLYHTATHSQLQLKEMGHHNYLERIWWWRIFRYFEGNVPGPLPLEHSLPLPDKLINLVYRRSKS